MRLRAVLGRVLLAWSCVEAPGRGSGQPRFSTAALWRKQVAVYWQASPGLCTRTYVLLPYYLLTADGTTYLLTYLLAYSTLPLAAQQAKQVDTWVEQYKSHATFKYIFRENGRDVLNKQNPESVKRTLKYLAELC